jgi:hypothetical protein
MTNRHVSRMLNEILMEFNDSYYILYGVDDEKAADVTVEQQMILSALSLKGITVDSIRKYDRTLQINLTLTP